MQGQSGIIAWFARNNVAANLLMLVLIGGGLFSAVLINKEVFPSFTLNLINVNVAYPGAAPQEIEEGINIKIEEAIQDVSGIKKITSVASDGVGSVTIEVDDGYDVHVDDVHVDDDVHDHDENHDDDIYLQIFFGNVLIHLLNFLVNIFRIICDFVLTIHQYLDQYFHLTYY